MLESPDVPQCHSPVTAGQSWGRNLCFSLKGPSSGQSCTSVKAQSPEQCRNTSGSFGTSCCSQALEETHDRDLCAVFPKVPKGAKQWPVVWPCCPPCSCLSWGTLQGCLCLSGWQRSQCHLIGILFSPEAWLAPSSSP